MVTELNRTVKNPVYKQRLT